MNGRDRILGFVERKTVDRLPFMPITMMFAADQIKRSYGEYASDYKVLVEGQIRTAERFDIDYVSCISDPAREAADCGAVINYYDDQPPAIDESRALLADRSRLAAMSVPDPYGGGRMTDRVNAALLFKHRVGGEKAIEGWIEGPCAEAADLRGINNLMLDFYDDPGFVLDLFDFVVEMELAFARAQVEQGIDLIGIGDAAASLVGPRIYEEFVFPAETRLVQGLQGMGVLVRLHICGNTSSFVGRLAELGCEIVDLDYPVSMSEARRQMGGDQVLLGNIHPVELLLNGTPAQIREALEQCHEAAGARYIVGAGCEVPRGTPPQNLLAMLEFARSAEVSS